MARPDGAARGDTPRRRPIVSGLGQVKSRAFVQVRELPSTLMYPRGGVVHADLPAFDRWSPLMFPRRVCCARRSTRTEAGWFTLIYPRT